MPAALILPAVPASATTQQLPAKTFAALRDLAYAHAGIEIKNGKEALVAARIAGRLRALNIESPEAYLDALRAAPSGPEMVHFLDAMTTNVTSFFREAAHFDALRELLEARRAQGQSRFRLWSAASSSGEEVYTMAMTAAEVLGLEADWRILGTDLSTRVLFTARAALYGPQAVTPIPGPMRAKYLQRAEGDTWRVIDALRRKTAFARLNLSTPPFPMQGPLDAVFCRNVMIYFDARVRLALTAEFERLMGSGGLLMIGHAESLLDLDIGLRALGGAVYEK
jgi:chemotaxis protein methyltransferase CheR